MLQIEEVSRQLTNDPGNALLYVKRAELYRQHQDGKEAEADLETAGRLDPKLPTVHLCRGRLLADSGRNAEAKKAFDRYLSAQPNDFEALATRSQVLARLGDRKAAAADLSRAIELMPEPKPDPYLERARMLAEDNELEQALAGLEEGIRALGPLLTLQQAALELEIRSRRYDAALARLETIMNRVARKESWLTQKGEVQLLAGRKEAARKTFQEALKTIQNLPPRLRYSELVRDLERRATRGLAAPEAEGAVKIN